MCYHYRVAFPVYGEILWTPGHSDDSVSLVLDSGIAFTGDLQPPLASDELSYHLLA